jgi:hypothetical protein
MTWISVTNSANRFGSYVEPEIFIIRQLQIYKLLIDLTVRQDSPQPAGSSSSCAVYSPPPIKPNPGLTSRLGAVESASSRAACCSWFILEYYHISHQSSSLLKEDSPRPRNQSRSCVLLLQRGISPVMMKRQIRLYGATCQLISPKSKGLLAYQ